jgi:hypothetical protein
VVAHTGILAKGLGAHDAHGQAHLAKEHSAHDAHGHADPHDAAGHGSNLEKSMEK